MDGSGLFCRVRDTLKRLQAASRQCLHFTLAALLPAILQSSPSFDSTGTRAFKGEI